MWQNPATAQRFVSISRTTWKQIRAHTDRQTETERESHAVQGRRKLDCSTGRQWSGSDLSWGEDDFNTKIAIDDKLICERRRSTSSEDWTSWIDVLGVYTWEQYDECAAHINDYAMFRGLAPLPASLWLIRCREVIVVVQWSGSTSHSIHSRQFRRRSSKPVTWLILKTPQPFQQIVWLEIAN